MDMKQQDLIFMIRYQVGYAHDVSAPTDRHWFFPSEKSGKYACTLIVVNSQRNSTENNHKSQDINSLKQSENILNCGCIV